MGALNPPLRKAAHDFAAIGVGQSDIHQHEIGSIGLGGAGAFGAGVDGGGFEFVVQRQLLHQRVAQIGIVFHDQDLAGIGHGYDPLGGGGRGTLSAVSWVGKISVRRS